MPHHRQTKPAANFHGGSETPVGDVDHVSQTEAAHDSKTGCHGEDCQRLRFHLDAAVRRGNRARIVAPKIPDDVKFPQALDDAIVELLGACDIAAVRLLLDLVAPQLPDLVVLTLEQLFKHLFRLFVIIQFLLEVLDVPVQGVVAGRFLVSPRARGLRRGGRRFCGFACAAAL